MSKCLQRNEKFLSQLQYIKIRDWDTFLKEASKDNIDALIEIILNIRNGNLKIDDRTFKILKKHRLILEKLCKKSVSLKEKKVLLSNIKKAFFKILPTVLTATGIISGRLICNSLGI